MHPIPTILLHTPTGKLKVLYNPEKAESSELGNNGTNLRHLELNDTEIRSSSLFENRGTLNKEREDRGVRDDERGSMTSGRMTFERTNIRDFELSNSRFGGEKGESRLSRERSKDKAPPRLPVSKAHLRRKRATSNLRGIEESEGDGEQVSTGTARTLGVAEKGKNGDENKEEEKRKEEEKTPSPEKPKQKRKVWRSWGWEYPDDEE